MKLLCALAVVVVAVAACPDRKEAIDKVGGAPKNEIDQAQARLHADEQKFQKQAQQANDAHE